MENRDDLAAILADCHERLDRGEVVDRRKLLDTHPELASELRSCFDLSDLLDQAIAGDAAGLLDAMPEKIDEYRLIREIGRGGMGVVYEAVQVPMDRRVALKVLSCSFEPRAVRRFRQEVRAAGSLSHPNVVPIHAMGRYHGLWYYAMERVEGRPLDRVVTDLRETGRPESASWTELARTFAGAADGLEAAHRAGIIHRDVKPSNLILDETGRLRIVDFGLARLGEGGVVTVTGALLGTPAYMSPEQAMARRTTLDHRTDVYSLGATLYETLTLEPPHHGDSLQEIFARIVAREVVPPRKVDPRIPRDLETIVLKAIAKDRSERYATAGEMAADLRRFADGAEIRAQRPGALVRCWSRVRRHRVPTALIGLALLFAAFTIALILILGGDGESVTGTYADHMSRARALRREKRWEEAVESFDAALAIEESIEALHLRGLDLSRLGRQVEAVASIRRARALDPEGSAGLQSLAGVLRSISLFEEALATSEEALAKGIHVPFMARCQVSCLRALGKTDEARRRAVEHMEAGVAARNPGHRAYLLAVAGRTEEAREILESRRAIDGYDRAIVYAVLDDPRGVRRGLEATIRRWTTLLPGVHLDWEIRRFLDDPEIRALADRLLR